MSLGKIHRIKALRLLAGISIFVVLIFSGCIAKSPPKMGELLELELPSSYQSKLDVYDSNADWIKQISKDSELERLVEEVLLNNWDFK